CKPLALQHLGNEFFTESGDSVVVELPRLDEGDVLLLK
ncbi:unnamed protein product, partial [marine sediment metagenome]